MSDAIELLTLAGPVPDGLLGLAAHARGHDPDWLTDPVGDEVAAAVAAVGDETGEVWLHLLGLVVEAGPGATIDEFLALVDDTSIADLLDHVVGVHVPAWHDVVPIEVLAAAACGDADARLRLLATPRYYAGVARRALPTLLALSPDEAADRIRRALHSWFRDVVRPHGAAIEGQHAGIDVAPRDGEAALDTVDRVTGLRFEPEPYTDRVVLVPQVTEAGWTELAQYRSARVIAFDPAQPDVADLDALAGVFAALGETSRLRILAELRSSPGGVSDLARATGLAKSTVHRHLTILRRAGLVHLAGQAWSYRYEPRLERLVEATEALRDHLDHDREGS